MGVLQGQNDAPSNTVAHVPTVKTGGPTQPSAAGDPAINEEQPEALNNKALEIIYRVRDKLTGRDFDHEETLDIPEQVDRLIEQATDNENLCQSYIGWCPFW